MAGPSASCHRHESADHEFGYEEDGFGAGLACRTVRSAHYKCPLVAVSGLSESGISGGLNDRFREKQPIECNLIGQHLNGQDLAISP